MLADANFALVVVVRVVRFALVFTVNLALATLVRDLGAEFFEFFHRRLAFFPAASARVDLGNRGPPCVMILRVRITLEEFTAGLDDVLVAVAVVFVFAVVAVLVVSVAASVAASGLDSIRGFRCGSDAILVAAAVFVLVRTTGLAAPF